MKDTLPPVRKRIDWSLYIQFFFPFYDQTNDNSNSFGIVLLKKDEANFLKKVNDEIKKIGNYKSFEDFGLVFDNVRKIREFPLTLDFEKFWMVFCIQYVFPKLEDVVTSITKRKYETQYWPVFADLNIINQLLELVLNFRKKIFVDYENPRYALQRAYNKHLDEIIIIINRATINPSSKTNEKTSIYNRLIDDLKLHDFFVYENN